MSSFVVANTTCFWNKWLLLQGKKKKFIKYYMQLSVFPHQRATTNQQSIKFIFSIGLNLSL